MIQLKRNVPNGTKLRGDKIIVGKGTINGKVPEVGGVPITGSVNPIIQPPEIKLIKPDEKGIVLVCIKTSHLANGDLDKATIESKLQADLPGALRADFSLGVNGFIPIALVRHDIETKKPISVHQHSVHNLQCRAYSSGSGTRIVYWAA